MAHIYTDVPPSELTAVARYILSEQERQAGLAAQDGEITSLLPWFPNTTQEGLEVFWEESGTESYIPGIPVRAFDAPVPEGTTPGTSSKRTEMVAMGIGYTIGEREMHARRAAQNMSMSAFLESRAMNHVERGILGANVRAELFRRDLFVNAALSIDEYGVVQPVTVGRAGGNAFSSGTAWSDTANADPHEDEYAGLAILRSYGLSWRDVVVITNRATFNQYTKLDAVKDDMNRVRALSGRVSRGEVNELRGERDLPPISICDQVLVTPNGTETDMIPDNYWMLAPRPGIPVGATVWGTPAVLEMQDVDIAEDDRPGPVALIEESDTVPPSRRTVVDALGLPVLQAPNWTVRIDTQSGL